MNQQTETVDAVGLPPNWQLTRAEAIKLAQQGVPEITNASAVDTFMMHVQSAVFRSSGLPDPNTDPVDGGGER